MRTASPRRALPALTALVCALLCALFLLHAKAVMDGVASALSLFAFSVFPALFPFFVLTSVLSASGVLTRAGRRCAPLMRPLGLPGEAAGVFLVGAVSGYPVGARLAAGLHLSQNQTERLVGLANLAGPMFLSGTVAASLLGAPALGWALILSQLLAALAAAGVSGALAAREEATAPAAAPGGSVPAPFRPGTALLDAIASGMLAMLRVCGAIVFFSALLCALRECGFLYLLTLPLKALGLPSALADAMAFGLFEKTSACAALASSSLPLALRAAGCSFFVSFGGLSILAQTQMFAPVRASRYLLFKGVQGLFSALFTYAAASLLPLAPTAPAGESALWLLPLCCAVLIALCLFAGARRTKKKRL